jgi:hypothetical protein
MTKSKKTDKTMVDEILHRKLKIGQPKAHWKFQIGKRISCSPSGTCCVTVKRQDYNLIWKSFWIWIPYNMGVKTNRTSYLRGNPSGHRNTKLKTSKHVIEQNEQEKPYYKLGRTQVLWISRRLVRHLWHLLSCYPCLKSGDNVMNEERTGLWLRNITVIICDTDIW